MNPLLLSLWATTLVALGVTACLLVIVACICRVNLMRFGQHKFGWLVLYILWAPFAMGMLIDMLTAPGRVDWWACFGIAGILLHIVLTRRKWSAGAPRESQWGGP